MPEEHHAIKDIACSSCHGSLGSNFAAGKLRAIHIWIATLSVMVLPSTISTGTLCFGLSFKYSGVCCCSLRRLSGRASNGASASVSVMYGASAQVFGA